MRAYIRGCESAVPMSCTCHLSRCLSKERRAQRAPSKGLWAAVTVQIVPAWRETRMPRRKGRVVLSERRWGRAALAALESETERAMCGWGFQNGGFAYFSRERTRVSTQPGRFNVCVPRVVASDCPDSYEHRHTHPRREVSKSPRSASDHHTSLLHLSSSLLHPHTLPPSPHPSM